MGAWGAGILQNDLAADVYWDFMDAYDEGQHPEEISSSLISRYAEVLETRDEAPSFWLALAKAQWECGQLQPTVLERVKAIAKSDAALAGWIHESERKRRSQAVTRLAQQLASPPKRVRKPVKHRAPKTVFDPGTCLSVSLYSGGYGAAIVLDIDAKSSKREVYTLVGALNGRLESPPPLSLFEKRVWLVLTHHNARNQLCLVWCNSRSYKVFADRLTVVGTTTIRPTDPKLEPWAVGAGYSDWSWIENQIRLQAEWDLGRR